LLNIGTVIGPLRVGCTDLVRVLDELVDRERGVVGFDDGVGDLCEV
jgi:hypothetical protein